MPDDRRAKPDHDRIDVNDPEELRAWAKRFGCTQYDIFAAVQSAGVMVKEVEVWLRRNGKLR
jgi:hypothetical protein